MLLRRVAPVGFEHWPAEERERWVGKSRVKKAIHDAFVFVDALGPAAEGLLKMGPGGQTTSALSTGDAQGIPLSFAEGRAVAEAPAGKEKPAPQSESAALNDDLALADADEAVWKTLRR